MARRAAGSIREKQTKRGTVYALRFMAYGERRYVTLEGEGWTRERAMEELQNVLADVRRGIWRPPAPDVDAAPEQRPDPTFHEFASEWLEARRHELGKRTIEDYEWALGCHLLPFFAHHQLAGITVEEVDRYKATKVREARRCRDAIAAGTPLRDLDGRMIRPLSNNSINKTLTRLSQILEQAVEYGYLDRNPARGKRRRLKAEPRRRASMGADQVRALLEAAGSPTHRALLATAIMAGGLRVSEVTGLRRRDIDLATSRLRVVESKTEAGVREVELPPDLRDELAAYVAASELAPHGYLFPGREGGRRDRHAVRLRVLYPAIERANTALEGRGLPTIDPAVTFHSLRRTYASLCAERGVDPAWTTAMIGHASSRFTIDVYTDVDHRRQSPAALLGGLIAGDSTEPVDAAAAPLGTSPYAEALEVEEATPEIPL